MNTEQYPSGLQALADAHYRLQNDRRLGVCREDLLTYIDRHKRRASAEPEVNRYACTTWNGGASNSTRKVFKFLLKLFKVNQDRKFVNFGKRRMDKDGFVRIFREEIQNATGLGSTAVGKALRRMQELEIIARKCPYDEDTGHRQAWFLLNPTGIYTALGALPGFRLAREEVRMHRNEVDRAVDEQGAVIQAPKINLVEAGKEPQNPPYSSSPPLSQSGQIISLCGSGCAGVAGPGMEPGAEVVDEGPATPGAHGGREKTAPAAPVEIFQLQEEGAPANQPASRMSQQMLANARNPRIQQMAEAARKAGYQLAPCGLDGGQPLLISAGRQISYPKLNKDGSVQQPFKPSLPPASFVPYEHPPEPSPYPRVPGCPEWGVLSESKLSTSTTPERVTTFILPHGENEVLKVLIRVFNLREEGMNETQMKKFLSWVRCPTPALQMNLRTLGLYERQRDGQRNVKDWWLNCKLDFFLNAWPKIVKITQAEDVVTSAMNDEAFRLACVAYSQPEHFLNIQIRTAAEHLSRTQFAQRGRNEKDWLLSHAETCDPAVRAAFYMANLRNPAIAPFMASTDANGAVTAARAGFDMTGGPMLRAKAALDSHLIVLLVESSRRKEHWAELDNDWVRQQARQMLAYSEPLRRVFEHFGVFSNYRDIGFISAATGAPHLVPGRDADQIREHYDVQIEAARISKQRFELAFFGRLAGLTNALEDSTWECLDEVRAMLKPFSHAH